MKLKCIANGATSLNGFTGGRVYKVVQQGPNSLVTVLNDNGHERVIIPGDKSPHLLLDDECTGHFEITREPETKTFKVKLVRDVHQYAEVTVNAEDANVAVNKALDMSPRGIDWRQSKAEIHHYERVEEMPQEKNVHDNIAGYDVEFDGRYDGGDYVTSVYIVTPDEKYSASLAKAEDTLTLDHCRDGREISISRRACDEIRVWAEDHGY